MTAWDVTAPTDRLPSRSSQGSQNGCAALWACSICRATTVCNVAQCAPDPHLCSLVCQLHLVISSQKIPKAQHSISAALCQELPLLLCQTRIQGFCSSETDSSAPCPYMPCDVGVMTLLILSPLRGSWCGCASCAIAAARVQACPGVRHDKKVTRKPARVLAVAKGASCCNVVERKPSHTMVCVAAGVVRERPGLTLVIRSW